MGFGSLIKKTIKKTTSMDFMKSGAAFGLLGGGSVGLLAVKSMNDKKRGGGGGGGVAEQPQTYQPVPYTYGPEINRQYQNMAAAYGVDPSIYQQPQQYQQPIQQPIQQQYPQQNQQPFNSQLYQQILQRFPQQQNQYPQRFQSGSMNMLINRPVPNNAPRPENNMLLSQAMRRGMPGGQW